MAGIYIHIPFCKRRCSYCDFYTEVALGLIPQLISGITKELHLRRQYLGNERISTIYFGGGTPSLLSAQQFQMIFQAIYNLFDVESDAEITFEANPDDLSVEYLQSLSGLPFNRISIGIQSFDDEDLKRINRRHTGCEAIMAVKNAQQNGFRNISIDLIYGLPSQTLESWETQLDTALGLSIQHISAYGLTYEENTALWKLREKGKLSCADDDTMNSMYLKLLEKIKNQGFEAYEISNFALPSYRSRHNTAYWEQKPYLGVGPSAHSYNLCSRQWNISSIREYLDRIHFGEDFYEIEELSLSDKYNDYVMVALRTSDGINLRYIRDQFGADMEKFCLRNIQPFVDERKVQFLEDRLFLTPEGIMISNLILVELMQV